MLLLLFMIWSFVLNIVHHNQLKKSSKINKFSSESYNIMHFGGHIGFLAAVFHLRENLRFPRSVFQTVRSKVHVCTEKTFTGKKGSFYLANKNRTETQLIAVGKNHPINKCLLMQFRQNVF